MAIYGLDNIEIKKNEPLNKHSTFHIGGNARIAFFPKSVSELISCIRYCKENTINFRVIGNASNVLFDDLGFDGAIIFTTHITQIEYTRRKDDTLVRVECGMSLTLLASEVGKKQSLSGLEFAYGIPGTVGGAVYMNAGAYGGQMSDVVIESEYLDINTLSLHTVSAEEHSYAYRHSMFMSHPEYVITSTTLRLIPADPENILEAMNKNMSSRREKQPLEYPNAGSTFKRPGENIFAAKLIQDANLKGYAIGGAQISEKHSGFVINIGGASCEDVLAVMRHVRETVYSDSGILLEPEVRLINCSL
jgi:UDP-N-acetylmuramate dehydrogenase